MSLSCRPARWTCGFVKSPCNPGPLGWGDFADPFYGYILRGNSPGILGHCDYGDPFIGMGTPTKDDRFADEFKLLKGKITDTTEKEYVAHVVLFFGSTDDYLSYAIESDQELDATKGLRKRIELSGDAQTVFYRWVRKAYQNSKVEDVPGRIMRGMSDDLAEKLKQVKATYKGSFSSGGFNPRPMKDAKYRYRLGTISEHGLGTAVDIEDHTNPILSLAEWKFIETLSGRTVVRTRAQWDKNPEALWQAITDLNDAFAKAVAVKVKAIEDERTAFKKKLEDEAKKPTPEQWYLDYVKEKAKAPLKTEPEPIKIVLKGQEGLSKWKDGFFTLDKELVKLMHDNGFLWGATFSNTVDLHHFEIE